MSTGSRLPSPRLNHLPSLSGPRDEASGLQVGHPRRGLASAFLCRVPGSSSQDAAMRPISTVWSFTQTSRATLSIYPSGHLDPHSHPSLVTPLFLLVRLVNPGHTIFLNASSSSVCTAYRSSPLLARSSAPASMDALVAFCPIGLAVRATSSLSIFSRVVRVRSSTSAAVRWAVGIGGSTAVAHVSDLLHGWHCRW